MIESFIVAINSVLPIVVVAYAGYLVRRKKVIGDNTLRELNQLLFKYLLPLNLFENIIQADTRTPIDAKLFIYGIAFQIVIIAVAMFAMRHMHHPNAQKGVIVHGLFRGNIVILGLPILQNIYPGGETVVMSFMIALLVPVYNVLGVFVLQYYGEGKGSLKQTVIQIFKNPMIIAAIVAVVLKLLPMQLPTVALKSLRQLTVMSSPLALLVLGANFKWQAAKENQRLLLNVALWRLVIFPAIGVIGAIALGFRGVELASLLIVFAAPIAVSTYPMATQMGLDGELASQIIIVTTAFVALPLMCFIGTLSFLQML